MIKKIGLLIFIFLIGLHPVWATRGPDDPIRWILPLMIFTIPLIMSILIYLIGNFLLKKQGAFSFTLLGSVAGMIMISIAIYLFMILKKSQDSSFIKWVLPFVFAGGLAAYFWSHNRNDKK